METHHILLKKDGSIFKDLTIDSVSEGDRNKMSGLLPFGILTSEGGITFRSPRGRSFFLPFSAFSILVNYNPPES